MTSQTGRTQTWDLRGRLSGATVDGVTTSYRYTLDGIRSSVTEGSTTIDYIIDGMTPSGYQQVVEETAGGVLAVRYTYGASLDPISETRDGTSSLYLGDGHSGVRQALSLAGAMVLAQRFDAFGVSVAKVGSLATPVGYRGERFDATLGQYCLRARYYDPRSGNFTGIDPENSTYKSPDELNRYAYSKNSPILYSDPNGTFAIALAAVGLGVSLGLRASGAVGATGAMAFAITSITTIALLAAVRHTANELLYQVTTKRWLTDQEVNFYGLIADVALDNRAYELLINGYYINNVIKKARLHNGSSLLLEELTFGGALARHNINNRGVGGITLGNDIFFNPNSFPGNQTAPSKILGHELMHVIQNSESNLFGGLQSEDIWLARYLGESLYAHLFHKGGNYHGNTYEIEAYAFGETVDDVSTAIPGLFAQLAGTNPNAIPQQTRIMIKNIWDSNILLERLRNI